MFINLPYKHKNDECFKMCYYTVLTKPIVQTFLQEKVQNTRKLGVLPAMRA